MDNERDHTIPDSGRNESQARDNSTAGQTGRVAEVSFRDDLAAQSAERQPLRSTSDKSIQRKSEIDEGATNPTSTEPPDNGNPGSSALPPSAPLRTSPSSGVRSTDPFASQSPNRCESPPPFGPRELQKLADDAVTTAGALVGVWKSPSVESAGFASYAAGKATRDAWNTVSDAAGRALTPTPDAIRCFNEEEERQIREVYSKIGRISNVMIR
jgi:hypothetical protein